MRSVAWIIACISLTAGCSSGLDGIAIGTEPDGGAAAASDRAENGERDEGDKTPASGGVAGSSGATAGAAGEVAAGGAPASGEPPASGAAGNEMGTSGEPMDAAGDGTSAMESNVSETGPSAETTGMGMSEPMPAVEGIAEPPPPGMVSGEPCQTSGSYRCVMQGATSRQRCGEDGVWGAEGSCNDGQVCIGAAGDCVQQDDFCKGKQGEFACVGSVMHKCDDTARSVEQNDCDQSPKRCELGLARGTCAECVPGEDYKCEGSRLMKCKPEGTGFELLLPCDSADLCNAEAHKCTDAACSPGQVRCQGQRLERCNAQQTGFELVDTCTASEICDPAGEECDACRPNSKRCEGGSRKVCATDGSAYRTDPCGSDAPYCTGQGECVACTSDTQCSGLAGVCEAARCVGNVCDINPTPGKSCVQNQQMGTCNSSGMCLGCTQDGDCGSGEQCVSGSCRAGTCGMTVRIDNWANPIEGNLDEFYPNWASKNALTVQVDTPTGTYKTTLRDVSGITGGRDVCTKSTVRYGTPLTLTFSIDGSDMYGIDQVELWTGGTLNFTFGLDNGKAYCLSTNSTPDDPAQCDGGIAKRSWVLQVP